MYVCMYVCSGVHLSLFTSSPFGQFVTRKLIFHLSAKNIDYPTKIKTKLTQQRQTQTEKIMTQNHYPCAIMKRLYVQNYLYKVLFLSH